MKRISPRAFRNAFDAVLKAEDASFRTAVGFEPKSYAYFMRTNIFPKVAKQLGLLAWNKSYLGLDGMFYEERGTDRFGKFTAYPKWIAVAVDHAMKAQETPEQINKLQLFNVPLKVLITYADEQTEIDALLAKYETVIKDSDIFNDIAGLRQQLVIVGTPRAVRQWGFYVYESDGFVLMLPH
jgi:hypothetical protein